MNVSPNQLLKDAIKAVPAVRYALGVAGIASVIALIAGLKLDYRIALFGTIILLGLMFVLLAFSSIATQTNRPLLRKPALVLSWWFIILTIVISILLMTSLFFSWPQAIEDYFPPQSSSQFYDLTLTGTITSVHGNPVSDVLITVAGYDFSVRSRHDGTFLGILKGVKAREVFTLRTYHKEYLSQAIDRLASGGEQVYNLKLVKR